MLWKIERVAGAIRVAFDPTLLFAHDSDTLTARAEEGIRDLVKMLACCHDMDCLINLCDDSTNDEATDTLSCKRMATVSSFARGLGLTLSALNATYAARPQTLILGLQDPGVRPSTNRPLPQTVSG